ncbi:MAG: hypothetical protein CVT92_09430 [Bacteroidetes bacterium HGW-Bacteroidetes-1]|jgi:aspartokinase/homoserine dehydrogenase 1|nr:MAG: hypothetical protein CVT92_09430 [Bacteroidetes bacterium HGW-Bacteroidetes-1]
MMNNFSENGVTFQTVLSEVIQKGLPQPNPFEGLAGNDGGRKVLILAQELD